MGRKLIKGIFQELPLWATGTQSHLGIVENGVGHTSQSLSYKGMRKLGNLYTYSCWSLVEGFCEGGCTHFLASLICLSCALRKNRLQWAKKCRSWQVEVGLACTETQKTKGRQAGYHQHLPNGV